MAYFTVSENVSVCCNVPDVAVTVTVDVTGVLLEEPPPGQRLRTTRTNPGRPARFSKHHTISENAVSTTRFISRSLTLLSKRRPTTRPPPQNLPLSLPMRFRFR